MSVVELEKHNHKNNCLKNVAEGNEYLFYCIFSFLWINFNLNKNADQASLKKYNCICPDLKKLIIDSIAEYHIVYLKAITGRYELPPSLHFTFPLYRICKLLPIKKDLSRCSGDLCPCSLSPNHSAIKPAPLLQLFYPRTVAI